MSSFITKKAAPLVLFGCSSALAIRFIFLNALEAGSAEKLEAACTPDAPYSLAYTGFVEVDHGLCQLVTIFHAGIGSEPEAFPILQYLLSCIPVVSMFLSAEASRQGGLPTYLAFPIVFGLLWQIISWGLVLSLYSLLFVISGVARRTGKSAIISEVDALSILVSFGVGLVIHFLFIYLNNPYSTIFWQVFPAVMAPAQYIAHNVLSSHFPTTSSRPGHSIIAVGYALTFICAASIHTALVLPHIGDTVKLQSFVPRLAAVDRETGSLEEMMFNMLKWDTALGSGAILLSSLWFASSLKELIGSAVAIVVGTVAVGPAAAFAAILIWRESKLGKASNNLKKN